MVGWLPLTPLLSPRSRAPGRVVLRARGCYCPGVFACHRWSGASSAPSRSAYLLSGRVQAATRKHAPCGLGVRQRRGSAAAAARVSGGLGLWTRSGDGALLVVMVHCSWCFLFPRLVAARDARGCDPRRGRAQGMRGHPGCAACPLVRSRPSMALRRVGSWGHSTFHIPSNSTARVLVRRSVLFWRGLWMVRGSRALKNWGVWLYAPWG